ncbi:flippase [Fictibacillus enclensis]|uniref:flippase n=1 Tax=Fictibacillus enclensis TaxID=1017270 RepID=UPI0024C04D16|nr:flippase [Fictibacillus enclensis]WHY71987.1 flippase [Fictibacillus enclensis]
MKTNIAKKFLGNTSWLIAQNIYSMLLSLVIGSLTARYLGPSNYGVLGYGASLITLFVSISKLGLDSVILNELIVQPEKKGDYLGAALVMRLIASIFSVIGISLLVFCIEPGNGLLLKVTFFQSLAIVFQVHETFNYWFQTELKSKYYVISSIIALTITGVWRIYLLYSNASVEWFALSTSIQALVIFGIAMIMFRKLAKLKLNIHLTDIKYLLSRSYHFIIANLSIAIYMQIDKIMLGKFMGEKAVGIYSAAMTIALLWVFIPNAIINSALPLIISERGKNYKGYIKRLQFLIFTIATIGFLAGISILVFGKLAVSILYGSAYMQSINTLYILIWSTSLAILGTSLSVWIVAEGLNAYQKYMALIGAAVNVVFNLIAIPKMGVSGAALATFCSQFVVQFIAPLLFKQTRPMIKILLGSFLIVNRDNLNLVKNLWYSMIKKDIKSFSGEKLN